MTSLRPWTPEEDALIARLVAEGRIKAEVMRSVPARRPSSVYNRLTVLGLTPRRLTAEEVQQNAAANGARGTKRSMVPAELTDEIRRLAVGGHTSTAIAALLGITRNKVIGLCRRRGIALRGSPGGQPGGLRPAKPRPAAPKPPPPDVRHELVRSLRAAPPPVPGTQGQVSMVDARHGQCRYIDGRPELITVNTPIFCGAPTVAETSWCAHHFVRCTAPLRAA